MCSLCCSCFLQLFLMPALDGVEFLRSLKLPKELVVLLQLWDIAFRQDQLHREQDLGMRCSPAAVHADRQTDRLLTQAALEEIPEF